MVYFQYFKTKYDPFQEAEHLNIYFWKYFKSKRVCYLGQKFLLEHVNLSALITNLYAICIYKYNC
jgi:hypothetical protein